MSTESKEKKIMFICWLAYAVAYIGRLNYAASIVAIVSDIGVTKAQAGLVSSFFFFAYGIGQLVNGILSRKYNSRIMVFVSLAVSSVLNLAMPFCSSISVMKYIWMLNGAVQSILWSTLIKTISEHVSDEKMSTAIVVMSTPTAAGTFAAYGLSALFVKYFNWRITFYLASVLLAVTAFVWFFLYGNDAAVKKVEQKDAPAAEKRGFSKMLILCLVTITFAGIVNGFVKDGLNTWVSSFLKEEYGFSESLSIFLTLILPIVSMVGATFVAKIHVKIKSSPAMNLVFYSLAAVVSTLILFLLKVHNVVFIMLSFTVVACLMAMVNNVITSVFPLDNRKRLGSGFLAGLLNTFCYVGSTITSYSLGAISDSRGWNAVFVIMALACAAACVSSVLGMVFEKKVEE